MSSAGALAPSRGLGCPLGEDLARLSPKSQWLAIGPRGWWRSTRRTCASSACRAATTLIASVHLVSPAGLEPSTYGLKVRGQRCTRPGWRAASLVDSGVWFGGSPLEAAGCRWGMEGQWRYCAVQLSGALGRPKRRAATTVP